MRTPAPALLALVLAVSCGGSGSPAPGGPAADASGLWALESGTAPSGEIVPVGAYPIKLELASDAAGGTAGCNTYSGRVEIDGSSFDAPGGFSLTEVGCPTKVAEVEERYIDALEAADTIQVDGDTLTLTGPDLELVYSLVPPVETKSLVDTTWVLDGLIEGTGPGGTVSSARPGRLRLSADGTYEGSTGCRDFSGEWTEAGDRVVFPIMRFSGECGPGETDQDNHVITVLASSVTVEVEGEDLTLMSARGGLGLTYRAE